jgi:drug/metabolite transporter (DMT)-like permease
VLFASDVAVWNIAIQNSSATQASLLVNLAPALGGYYLYVFLNTKPATNFLIGTTWHYLEAMLVGFKFS